jgi:lantibiotic biosynthesis protein
MNYLIESIKPKEADILKSCMKVANALKDPQCLEGKVTKDAGEFISWNPTSLSHGFPGNILLFTELHHHFPNDNWDEVSHQHVLAFQKEAQKRGIADLSLFNGWAGITFSLEKANKIHGMYDKNIHDLHFLIKDHVKKRVDLEYKRLHQKKGINPLSYDVIYGLTGIGRYLLNHSNSSILSESLTHVLQYLIDITNPIKIQDNWVPGWYIPAEYLFNDDDRINYPLGNFNCGMAHGIPGPLALLSLAYLKGIRLDGQKEAISNISSWLLKWKIKDEYGDFWPYQIPLQAELDKNNNFKETRKRESWCYGTLGVARALQLAGKALDNKEMKNIARQATLSIASKPLDKWQMNSPIICHGFSGVFQMLNRILEEPGNHIKEIPIIDDILLKILSLESKKNPLIFSDKNIVNGKQISINKIGLLEGTPGIALSLLNSIRKNKTNWDNVLLIS